MIKVLVVEDSRVVRDYLVWVIESDPQLRVIGTAGDGETAVASVEALQPDVVLMDVHLPGIDGIETTRRIMSSNPVPIVVCTASSHFDELKSAMSALEAGALALLKKPQGIDAKGADAECAAIISTLKLMSEVKVVRRWDRPPSRPSGVSQVSAMPWNGADLAANGVAMIGIGASTGGPPAILQILSGLSPDLPVPILVVQHITTGFIAGFAKWLADASNLPVHVGQGGETPLPGHVYVAPDDLHLELGPTGALRTTRDEPLNGLRPSVGILFRSLARHLGGGAIGVLLTGMGRDGAEELKLMADRGALTIAQEKESCVVFGMPAEAIKLGAARFVLPPQRIAEVLNNAVRRGLTKEARHD